MENFEIAIYVIIAMGSLVTVDDMQQVTKDYWAYQKEHYGSTPETDEDGILKRYLFKTKCVAYPLIVIKNTFWMFLAALGAHLLFL